jgi:hypothetical protein
VEKKLTDIRALGKMSGLQELFHHKARLATTMLSLTQCPTRSPAPGGSIIVSAFWTIDD